MKTRKIEISHKSIIFTILFLLALAFFWQIRSIITLVFVGFVLMEAINPLVRQLEKIRIPRVLSILIVSNFLFIFSYDNFPLCANFESP